MRERSTHQLAADVPAQPGDDAARQRVVKAAACMHMHTARTIQTNRAVKGPEPLTAVRMTQPLRVSEAPT